MAAFSGIPSVVTLAHSPQPRSSVWSSERRSMTMSSAPKTATPTRKYAEACHFPMFLTAGSYSSKASETTSDPSPTASSAACYRRSGGVQMPTAAPTTSDAAESTA